jgi:hypothetical protein
MTSMDISALGAAPLPDTPPSPEALRRGLAAAVAEADARACAETLTGAPDIFAALLDEAAATTADSLEPSDAKDVDADDVFDESAALAMTTLLPLSTPVSDTVDGTSPKSTSPTSPSPTTWLAVRPCRSISTSARRRPWHSPLRQARMRPPLQ